MSDLNKMSKAAVVEMLQKRAQLALELDAFDKEYPDVFCGVKIDYERDLHIFGTEVFKQIADVLGKKYKISPYSEEEKDDFPYLGTIYFWYEYAGKKWKVFALYSDESEEVN